MGAMRFLTGSHREGMSGLITAEADLLAQRPELFERYEMSPPLHYKPGDATVHQQHTIHGGYENTTERPRINWNVSFIPADARYIGRWPMHSLDDLNLDFRDPIDHPRFPIVGE
jgi:ectoine hydroxylase-related dioxygenase (phytanoyl-CoA dioxygenase family)